MTKVTRSGYDCLVRVCLLQLFEVQLGTVSTLGFVIARQIYNEKSKRKEQQTTVVEDMEVEFEDAKFTVPDLLSDCVEKIGLFCHH